MPEHPTRPVVGRAEDQRRATRRCRARRQSDTRRRPPKRAQATEPGATARRRALFLSRSPGRRDRDHRRRFVRRGPRPTLPRHPRAASGVSDPGGPVVNQEEALRTDVHQALDAIAGPTPELLPAIAPRLRPASRRRPLSAIGQVAAVLGIGLIVGGIVFATHRARVAPATVTTAPTAPIVAGPGANIAWVTSQQSR